ncbi:MAG TPA: alpha/beta fold hydrolase [Syntrophales bacterium]|nr:alpha/beta fold hydrolase [Syntrophales bacterium]
MVCFLIGITVGAFIYVLSGGGVSKSVSSLTGNIGDRGDYSQWFRIEQTKRLRGIALVVHGLNLRPDRMQSIVAVLRDAGVEVLNVSLRGHGNNYLRKVNLSSAEARLDSFRSVSYGLWSDEIYDAYLKVRERAFRGNLPVFLVGYSLGGLLGCNLALSRSDVCFDRVILFAPAFNVTAESYLLKALMSFPSVVIDSLSPVSYRANEGTPMSAYKALFEAVEYFEKNADDRLNKPTIIFIDEKDEFISCSKMREMLARNNFNRWQIHAVQKDGDVDKKISRHLIIDEASVGEHMWRRMKGSIRKHLTLKTSGRRSCGYSVK